MATELGDTQEGHATGEETGSVCRGLHHLARFCPGRCMPFLTFLDHGLVQEAHSRLVHGLQIGQGGGKDACRSSLLSLPKPLLSPLPVLSASPNAHHPSPAAGDGRDQDSPALHHLRLSWSPGCLAMPCKKGIFEP